MSKVALILAVRAAKRIMPIRTKKNRKRCLSLVMAIKEGLILLKKKMSIREWLLSIDSQASLRRILVLKIWVAKIYRNQILKLALGLISTIKILMRRRMVK